MKAINAKFNTHSNSNLVPDLLKLVQLARCLPRHNCLSQRQDRIVCETSEVISDLK